MQTLVITTIARPNEALKQFASYARRNGIRFIAIGDTMSPNDFVLEGCDFWSIDRQLHESQSKFAMLAPTRHYARKNLGFMLAKRSGAEWILETDDDNHPYESFWSTRSLIVRANTLEEKGWVNAYHYFTDEQIWPRGLPLEEIQGTRKMDKFSSAECCCPIQQGLANGNPDIDAIYRFVLPIPFNFQERDMPLALGPGSWCPFNSQNTSWHSSAFLLTYLPSYCNFRMTDIWRSFVAQRIAWENQWHVLFHNATVLQRRNDHDLLKDFEDEIPGYLNNARIAGILADIDINSGVECIPDNLMNCYKTLISHKIIGKEELTLLETWLEDMMEEG